MTRKLSSSFFHQPRHELLAVADTVSKEKGIEKEEVLVAMELAMQRVARGRYGMESDIRVSISRQDGVVHVCKVLTVVEFVENTRREISLEDAREIDPQVELGGSITEELPPIEFGRVSAQGARQVIFQKVREAERAHQYEEFKDRVGQVMSALIKRVEFGNLILDLGRTEGIVRRQDLIPREVFRTGDRVRVYITELKADARGPMVCASRVHNQFVARLFEQEVPEIYDGLIEVKGVARDPGSRAKMAVFTSDTSIDPVGSCVGMRGARVQAVMTEIRGEKIDIVPWSANPATFVVNALAPAEVVKVVLDEENKRVDVVVGNDQLSLAIGRRGQNVRLASQLTGWNIDILTEEQESKRRMEEHAARTTLFIQALDVDEMIAQLLASEGYASVEEIADAPLGELANLEGFDDDVAAELQNRALMFLKAKADAYLNEAKDLGLSNELVAIESLSESMLLTLAKNNIKTLDDFADLAGDELLDVLGKESMTLEQANALIMIARAHWFEEK